MQDNDIHVVDAVLWLLDGRLDEAGGLQNDKNGVASSLKIGRKGYVSLKNYKIYTVLYQWFNLRV